MGYKTYFIYYLVILYHYKEKKMKECVIVIDVSSVFYEGRRLSASNKKLPKRGLWEAVDHNWTLNFDSLLKEVAGKQNICSAIVIGFTSILSDTILSAVNKNDGFKIELIEGDTSPIRENEKGFIIGTKIAKVIYTYPEKATLKLVSCKGEFAPFTKAAFEQGWEIESWEYRSHSNSYPDYIATDVKYLDDIFEKFSLST
jgi:hypothetical protein